MEKELATHSSVLAWRIPGMVEPGGLSSVGSHGVGHDWSDSNNNNNYNKGKEFYSLAKGLAPGTVPSHVQLHKAWDFQRHVDTLKISEIGPALI